MSTQLCSPRTAGRLLVLLALALQLNTTISAQSGLHESAAAAQMRSLNNSLLKVHGQMQMADPNSAGMLRSQAATIISRRSAALNRLIQNDPQAALSFAFSPELLSDLAAKFPQAANGLEAHTTLTGKVERWTADYRNRSALSWMVLRSTGRSVTLHFANAEPSNLKNGDVLQATGVIAGTAMAVEQSTAVNTGASTNVTNGVSATASASTTKLMLSGLSALAFPLAGFMFALPGVGSFTRKRNRKSRNRDLFVISLLVAGMVLLYALPVLAQTNMCSTTGTQKTAVLLVTFPGVTPPSNINTQTLTDMFFGANDPSLDRYWQEASYGQTRATGTVTGPYTLTGTYSCTNVNQFINDAITTAANSGVDFSTNNRVSIVFPDMSPSCGWAGLSSIGCYSVTTPSGTYNLSTSALVWSDLTPSYATGLIAHESGHQLGMAHSRLRQFGTEPLGALGTTGTLTEYGDHFASMGYPNDGQYAAGHKAEILGWLSGGTNYQVVQQSGTYTIQPYETNPAGLVALKVQRGTGNSAWLWIEYRQALGFYDSLLYPTQPFTGALIHYEDSVTGPQTDLLDFTAPTTYADNPALTVGQNWTDPYTNLSLSVVSANSAGLTLNVSYGATPCTRSNPALSLTPANPSVYAGSAAGYSLTVTNKDSSGCSASTFSMDSTQPSGWPTSFSANSLSLSPGQSGTITMQKTSPMGTTPGTYASNANAFNTSNSGSGTANITVVSPAALAVTTAVGASTFSLRSTVPMTATVLNGGVPASGATVTFSLTSPNGTTLSQSATTNSAGVATWNYKLSPRALTGSYSVSSQAALTSGSRKSATTQSATSSTVTFVVQ